MLLVLIALGSACGGMARHWCAVVAGERWGTGFPWGTLAVNVIGSFLLAGWLGLTGTELLLYRAPSWHQLFTLGILGGFTTFSSYSLQTLSLLESGRTGRAAIYGLGMLGACLAAAGLGLAVGASLQP
jgi:fluoride exporter